MKLLKTSAEEKISKQPEDKDNIQRHKDGDDRFLFFFFLIYFWLCWVFVSVRGSCGKRGPPFIAVRGPLTIAASLVGSTGSRRTGSVVVAHGSSCSAACGIFPDQGSNPCPLHWQADSQPLRHQESPYPVTLKGQNQHLDPACSPRYYFT